MALSGSLDTFALPDVLRLLASTSKTGRLHITGDRGSGSVWVDGGQVVASELASVVTLDPTAAEVVFGLLRFTEGSFDFEVDATSPEAGPPQAMEPILAEAELMLDEWRAIEEVIPSLDVWVGLAPELTGADVTIDRARWSGIATIGSGAQVGAVAEALGLNEIESCRLVKELIELGLVGFIDVPSAPVEHHFEPEPVQADASDDDQDADGATGADEAPTLEAEALLDELGPSDFDPSTVDPADDGQPVADAAPVPSLAALGDELDGDGSVDDDAVSDGDDLFGDVGTAAGDDDLDPAEMARQLANLSPKAAKAVAAAAKATTDAEREAALAAVEAEDDSVNRGLLLKFLGSVESSS